MKFNTLLFTAFSSLIFTLISCKKETNSTETPNTTTPADSSYLSVIYDIFQNGAIVDTVASMTYFYDANKRVSKLKDSVWNPTIDYKTETTIYFYHGTDTLPYRSTQTTVWVAARPDEIINSFYFYNAAGLRVKDSVIAPSYHYVALQQYQPDKIISSRVDSFFSPPAYNFFYKENRKDTATLDANGNVISNISRHGTTEIYRSTVTYDNHPTPSAKLSNAKTLALFPTGETLFMEMSQKNNRLKIVETYTLNNQPPITNYEDDLTGKYIYKTNGYPSKITVTDPSTGEINIASFTYISL